VILVKLLIAFLILYLQFHTGLAEDENKGTHQMLFVIVFLSQLRWHMRQQNNSIYAL
jgi:hypothetical protein